MSWTVVIGAITTSSSLVVPLGALRGEHADDFEVAAVDLHVLPDRASRRRTVPARPSGRSRRPACACSRLRSVNAAAFGDLVAVRGQVSRGGADERGRFVAGAAVRRAFARSALTTGEALLHVRARGSGSAALRRPAWSARRRSRCSRARRRESRPAGITISTFVPRLWMRDCDRLGGAVADGDQHDHRGDADRHAEDRQPGAQLVGGDPAPGDAQWSRHRSSRRLRTPGPLGVAVFWRRTRAARRARPATPIFDDLAVAEADHALGLRRRRRARG